MTVFYLYITFKHFMALSLLKQITNIFKNSDTLAEGKNLLCYFLFFTECLYLILQNITFLKIQIN